MLAVELGHIDINLKWLDEGIYKEVPSGRNGFETRQIKYDKIKDILCLRELKDTPNFEKQIGTLGGR